MHHLKYYFIVLASGLIACGQSDPDFAGSGVFEAQEIVVSALGTGQILEFTLEEGSHVKANTVVGYLDCDELTLQKQQVEASRDALKLKQVEAQPETEVIKKQISTQQAQVATLQTQFNVIKKDRERIKALVDQDAAPKKQLDDLQGQLDVLQGQITAAQRQLDVLEQQSRAAQQTASLQNRGIMSEDSPLQTQIARIENQIGNCTIVNPIAGTVLAKYAEPFEFIAAGKPLYKIADLNEMILRAYVGGNQLSDVEIGQHVQVRVDDGNAGFRSYDGTITWIAEKAEFTPKTIQTKDERENLVYAVKIKVQNDGLLRIGMYGELEL